MHSNTPGIVILEPSNTSMIPCTVTHSNKINRLTVDLCSMVRVLHFMLQLYYISLFVVYFCCTFCLRTTRLSFLFYYVYLKRYWKVYMSISGLVKAEMTEVLLRHGAHINVRTHRGYSVLDRCVFHYVIGDRKYNISSLKTLVVAGAHLKPLCIQG